MVSSSDPTTSSSSSTLPIAQVSGTNIANTDTIQVDTTSQPPDSTHDNNKQQEQAFTSVSGVSSPDLVVQSGQLIAPVSEPPKEASPSSEDVKALQEALEGNDSKANDTTVASKPAETEGEAELVFGDDKVASSTKTGSPLPPKASTSGTVAKSLQTTTVQAQARNKSLH